MYQGYGSSGTANGTPAEKERYGFQVHPQVPWTQWNGFCLAAYHHLFLSNFLK